MDEIHRMLSLVKDPNPQIRKYALTQVEELADGVDDEEVLEVLREAARDTVPLVSHQAIRSLARLLGRAFLAGPSAGVELGDERFEGVPVTELRLAGLQFLRPAIDRLQDIVRGDDKRAARRALVALGKIAAPGSTRVVASCLNDPALAAAAAIALPGIGGEEALLPLVEAARSESSPGRLHAVLELGRFREEPARDLVLKLAKDENAAIRANAAMALSNQRCGEDSREVLGTLLSDAEVWVTVYAIRGLAHDKSAEAAQLVATAYHKVEDPHVQASCLAVLGGMGPVALPAAEAVLASGLGHPDDRVRANAVEAASCLVEDGYRLASLIGPLSTDPNNRVMANVAVGLARDDVPSALEILDRLAGTDDKWFQTSAAWAAGAIARPEAFRILTSLATSQDTSILLMIVRSLEAFPANESLPLLNRLATSADALVRGRAAEALGTIGGDQVAQFLAGRLAHEQDDMTRGNLVHALAQTRSGGVSAALTQALADSHPRVRANAVEALGRVGSLDVLTVVRPFASGENTRLRANAWIALWRLGEMDMAEEAARSLAAPAADGIASAIYATGEMGRELRQLGQQSSNLLLLGALKGRVRGGSGSPSEGTFTQTLRAVGDASRPPPAPTQGHDDPDYKVEDVLEKLLATDFAGARAAIQALPPSTAAGVGTFLLSRVKLAQKDQAAGLQLLEEACAARVGCLSAHLDLANYYLRSRRDREAAERFLFAFELRRDVIGEVRQAAEEALKAGNLTAVSRILKFLFGAGAMSADTNVKVGREFLALGDARRAIQFLFLARVEFPRDVGVALDYAVTALRCGKTALAQRLAQYARKAGGQDPVVVKRLAALDQALARGGEV